MTIYIKKPGGTWSSSVSAVYVKNTTWRTVSAAYVKVSGAWRKFFPDLLTPAIESTVEISRNNATYPSTLTGTNYHWNDSTSLTYVFQKSADNSSWSNIGSATSIANPSSGSSNTVTYALTLSDFPAFTSYYRFVVTAVNSTYSTSATSTSSSVTVNKPAPINSVAPTISPSSGTVGVTTYSVTSNGTWDPDDADGTYEYLWQSYDTPSYISAPGTNNQATYTPPSNFLALGYLSPIRCRVTATNASGSTAAFSNTATVLGAALTPTFGSNMSVAGGFTGSVTNYDSNYTWNTPSVAGGTLTAGTFTWSSPVGSTRAFTVSGLGSLASSTVTVTTTRSGYNSGSAQTTGTALAAPSASSLATSDSTITPGSPSSITVANTGVTNQGNVTWTNGSNATSAWVSSVTPGSSYTGTDGGSLLTSQLFTITSSATAVATVNNKNNNRKVTVSWSQANAASYSVSGTISGSSFPINGTSSYTGNASGSTASFDVTLGSGGGTFTANSVTVYSGANQTGVSSTFTPGTAPSTTPTDKTSSNTGSGSVTYTPAAPVNTVAPSVTPTSGTAGSTTYSSTTGTWTNSPTSYAYQWQYLDQGTTYLSISGATSSTYLPPSNFFSLGYASPIRCRVTATNGGGSTSAFSNTATVSAAVSIPSGGSVSLSGTGVAGTTITATTSGWSGSPTSYSVRIYASTSNPPTTSNLLVASSSSSSVSYTVTTSDASPPAYYFKAFATATNGAGTSSEVGSNVILSSLPASIPATPTGVTNTYNGGTSYTFSWTASSGATSYSVNYGENTTAPSPNPPASIVGNVTTGTINVGNVTSYSYTSSSSSNYVGFRVAAVNSAGTSAYSSPTQYK